METTHTKPTQSCGVAMNGQSYAWDADGGLDPAAALEVVGFIRRKAAGYASRARMAGLELEDLVQEGLAGALKAAAKYNPQAGANYLTYAAWWIDAAMKEALSRLIIRTPEGEAFARVDSLDVPLCDEETASAFRMNWQRSDHPDAYDAYVSSEAKARVRQAMPNLSPRDRAVLVRHLGLDGRQPQTLQVVARELGVSRQRAGQILDRARATLREHLDRRIA
jgi:RNA polymerase sigma factor (sigma-70 family)